MAITRRSSSARDAMVPLPGGTGYALRMIADARGDSALSAATVIISPSKRKTALSASHSRAALCAIVSSTGCRSVGERLMTLEHLAGRGLIFEGCLKLALARLLRLEQPRVLDGDDGLVGEGLDKLDLLVGERLTALRAIDE